MEKGFSGAKSRKSILDLVQQRQVNTKAGKFMKKYCQFTDDLVRRLGLEHELQGHQGCVNCLQWSQDGRLLASGSDDMKVIIWDALRHKQVIRLPTIHFGNIFSVKFLGTNNGMIATAAGDFKIYVQSIDATPIMDCSCHTHRVKRLATSPLDPTVFWSAGEDGMVMQFDLREPHECTTSKTNLLISYPSTCEVKCIAINPTKPHYLSVGGDDAFVRVYDRRKMKTVPITNKTDNEFIHPSKKELKDANCVQYYSPGHLALLNNDKNFMRYAVTYIAFNASGSEMLVDFGGEQIYLFDVNHTRPVEEIKLPSLSRIKSGGEVMQCSCKEDSNGSVPGMNGYLKKPLENLCKCFYLKRGHQLYQRKWVGDLYNAARDYLKIIQACPSETKAYIGLIKCLVALAWPEDARTWLDYLKDIQPKFAADRRCQSLVQEIEDCEKKPKEHSCNDILDPEEMHRRINSIDYEMRFMGHCNTTTDIKEANFLGEDGHYIAAGSDEGLIFIWERKTQSIVNALVGDVSIVNCVQPHPSLSLLATSGIDTVVKLWSPLPENGEENIRAVKDIVPVVKMNQKRMSMDPLEMMLSSIGFLSQDQDIGQCRPS